MAFQLILPDIGEGVVEAEVQKWFVAPGDEVVEDQPLVEVMTDKATVTIPSPRRGKVTRLFWKEGDLAQVHSPLLEIDLEAGGGTDSPVAPAAEGARAAHVAEGPRAPAATQPTIAKPADEAARPAATPVRKALATPATRALARELGLDIDAVQGTGPGGRVTKDDLRSRAAGNGHSVGTLQAPASLPGGAPAEERVPLRGVRRRIAEKMALSKRTAAHFTLVEQADVAELVKVKEKVAAAARDEGVRVTFLPFVVKAVVAALKKFPQLNASLDEERQEIVLKRHYDVGIASSTEAGLLVPVVRGADRRSLLDLAREIERLAEESKAGKARPEDQGGSTFTVTSLGALGGLFATPVINYPEVAILGIHRIRPTPVARDGQVVVRDVMHVSLTSDHRVVDGHVAAAFTAEVVRLLEEPSLLLLRMA